MPIRIDDYQRQRRAGFGPFLHNADPLVRLDWYLQGLSNFHAKTKKLCNHYLFVKLNRFSFSKLFCAADRRSLHTGTVN